MPDELFTAPGVIPDMPVLPRFLSYSLLAALLSSCGGSSGGDGPPVVIRGTGVERVDLAMNDTMGRYAPPGSAVAVVRNGRLVVVRNTAREPEFFSERVRGLRRAVEGITDWPATDLFARYRQRGSAESFPDLPQVRTGAIRPRGSERQAPEFPSVSGCRG